MKLLREPLVHFLLIGAVLFGLHSLGPDKSPASPADDRIVVSSGRIEQLASIFAKTWQRPPTAKELRGLIDDFVLEEVYYRQAKAMGLDNDDTMIRRRLRQKVEFLTDDIAQLATPTGEDLQSYLAANPDKFRRDPTYTFSHVFLAPDRHGPDPLAYAREQAARLRNGEEVEGDPTLLPAEFEQATRRTVDSTFGLGFSESLDALIVGEWSDPLRSGFGIHLIRLDARQPGRLPELDEIRPTVQREWANDRRNEMRGQFNRDLLDGYEIVIEWPERESESGGRE